MRLIGGELGGAALDGKSRTWRGYGSAGVTNLRKPADSTGTPRGTDAAWSTVSVQYPNILTDGKFLVVAQEDMTGVEALNARGVPVTALAGDPLATQLMGRSECDRIVVFAGNPRLSGTTAEVEIHDCTVTTLIGSIVTKEVQHGSSDRLPILS